MCGDHVFHDEGVHTEFGRDFEHLIFGGLAQGKPHKSLVGLATTLGQLGQCCGMLTIPRDRLSVDIEATMVDDPLDRDMNPRRC